MGVKTWIDSDIWTDTDDLSVEDKLLFLCLLTNGQRNIAGYYKLSIDHLALDMHLDKAELKRRLQKKQKYWIYDKETSQVLIPMFMKYNVVKSAPQIKKLNIELKHLRPCFLDKIFADNLENCLGIGAKDILDEQFLRRC